MIPHIFNFLVLLSYERYHSKSIISMPKIIQLCDGIMASGQHPTTHGEITNLRGARRIDFAWFDVYLRSGGRKELFWLWMGACSNTAE